MNLLMKLMYTKNKYRAVLEQGVFPLILFLFPLILVNQGVDVSDTGYSLGYYRFMDQMDSTWVLATYLANLFGAFLMKLPLGDTLLGMNLYTGLIVSLLGLICYYSLRRWISAWLVFLGEWIAIALCWCPTVILYNYLTYFLFAAGCLFLYHGIMKESKRSCVLAGICLGLNLMVRFSNLPQAGLILALWFACYLNHKTWKETAAATGLCLAGYLAAVFTVMGIIILQFGTAAYGEMIAGLFGMTKEASDYTLGGMLMAIGSAYIKAIRWLLYMVPCTLAGCIMFYLKKGKWERGKKLLYLAGMAVLLRFYLGQGMFTLRYYDYESVFQWMMLFLILGLIFSIGGIFGFLEKTVPARVMSCMVLLIILITPVGSNNYTFQNMNNLFLVAPFTLWAAYRLWLHTRKDSIHFPWQAFMILICGMTLFQGVLFGSVYVFRDGNDGTKRDTLVLGSDVLEGMYTTKSNAESLSGLIAFWKESGLEDSEVLIWGDAPGLSYILDVPSAIFTTWPEIPSNTYDQLDQALTELTWNPPVILHNETGQPLAEGEKSDLILDFLAARKYSCIYKNENYQILLSTESENFALRTDGRRDDSF